jgi:hypothetical protein
VGERRHEDGEDALAARHDVPPLQTRVRGKHDPWDSIVRYWNGVEQKDGWDVCPENMNPFCFYCKKCGTELYEYSKEIGMLKVSVKHEVCESCSCVAHCHKCTKARRRAFLCRSCRRAH